MIAGGSIILCLVLPGVALVLMQPSDRISAATRDRIQPGMTAAEVEALIGLPAGNYSSPVPWLWRDEYHTGIKVQGAVSERIWTGKHGQLKVFFDANGKVVTAFFIAH
jgi:hypothetical protein